MPDDPDSDVTETEDSTDPESTEDQEDKTFTQADVDRIVSDRLKRERSKFSDYDDLKQKAQRLDAAEEADKTEKQRLEEQLEQLKPTAHEAAKLRVALRKGLTETQAKRLVGESEEDLEADADDLLASFQSSDSTSEPDTSRRPQERLKPGATPDSEPEETDPRKLAADVPRY